MNVTFGDRQIVVTEAGDGFIWAEIKMDLPDMQGTLSAKLEKKDYSLSQLRSAVFAALDRNRALISMDPKGM